MNISELKLIRLDQSTNILSFDCDDDDLNDFLLSDSKHYQAHLLAVTYLLQSKERTLAYFSVLNDKISINDAASNRTWRKMFNEHMPDGKRYKSYPAMKIGRLAVDNSAKGSGLGTQILDYLKNLFVNNNRTGCRYITVDAYRQSLSFYEKNGFNYLTDNDKEDDTRLMYYDLIQII